MDVEIEPADAWVGGADIALDGDVFVRTLLRHLTGALEDVVGVGDASGFVSIVGQTMGAELDAQYKRALSLARLDAPLLARVLVDLKHRIGGDFYVIEESEDRIVFGNHTCPFGDMILGRPSLCMMTSSIFGVVASRNVGYAKVVLEQTIAAGDRGCRVVLHLRPTEEARDQAGRCYFPPSVAE
jgi:predicted ArsR family transcriptional regulator